MNVGHREFLGIAPIDDAHRAYGYLFAMTFGLFAGGTRSAPDLSNADYASGSLWGVGCFAAAVIFTILSTNDAHCRAKRLLRCGLYALGAFFAAAAFNTRVWNALTLVDLLVGAFAVVGAVVLALLIRECGFKANREAPSFGAVVALFVIFWRIWHSPF